MTQPQRVGRIRPLQVVANGCLAAACVAGFSTYVVGASAQGSGGGQSLAGGVGGASAAGGATTSPARSGGRAAAGGPVGGAAGARAGGLGISASGGASDSERPADLPRQACQQNFDEVRRRFLALRAASDVDFQARYVAFADLWAPTWLACEDEDNATQQGAQGGQAGSQGSVDGPMIHKLKAEVSSLDPTQIAKNVVKQARSRIENAGARLDLVTTEVAMTPIRDEALAQLRLAEVAYATVAGAQGWSHLDCLVEPGTAGRDHAQEVAELQTAASHGAGGGAAGGATAGGGGAAGSKNNDDGGPSRPKGHEPDHTAVVAGSDRITDRTEAEAGKEICDARQAFSNLSYAMRVKVGASKSLCGGYDASGGFNRVCASYGFISAAVSQIWKLRSDGPSGSAGGRFVSLAIPYAGLRVIPWKRASFVAFDINAYSAYFTTDTLASSPAPAKCTAASNAVERSLPCESKPQVRPYAALGAGFTLGRSGVGYISLVPLSIGFANFGAQGVHPFFGMYASSLQLTGTF